jgi:DNA-binding NtrC family response regulator
MPPLSPLKHSENWTACDNRVARLNKRSEYIPLPEKSEPPILIGESAAMKQLFSVIKRIAPTESSVLITGATGTGKELVARAIHNQSGRRGPFVGVNCSTLPETLVEAELFGHERGSFTGADERRPGLFEVASGGTLLLDEIDALSLPAQAKLLRVLQERSVRRVGGRVRIAIDVRVISSSNSDLAKAVAAGTFRADLYYRLRVLPLHLPELCKREGDVESLIRYFLKVNAERSGQPVRHFTADAMQAMLNYPWPGNVRELENAVEYALVIGQGEDLSINDLPIEIANHKIHEGSDHFAEVLDTYRSGRVPLAEMERRYILSVLEQFGGNQVKTAAALGIDRSKLYRRLKQYGVMAVRFLQDETQDGMQLLSRREPGQPAEESKPEPPRSAAASV